MSGLYKNYLQLVEKIRDLVNNKFSDGMEKKPATEGLLPEKAQEVLKDYSAKIRAEVLNAISKAQPEIESMKTSTQRDRKMTLYPGLFSMEDIKKQIGIAEQSNAILIFNANWPQGNLESIISSLQNAIETKQYVFASTLFEQIKNSKSSTDLHDLIKNETEKLETEYFKTLGMDVYDEKLMILDYADKIAQVGRKLIERSEISGDERLYIPEYPVKEFQDKMILANISRETGIDIDSHDASAITSVASPAAGE